MERKMETIRITKLCLLILFLHFRKVRCDYEYVSQQTDGDVIYYKHDGKLVTGTQSYHDKEMEAYQSCIQICEADERCDFLNVIEIAAKKYQCYYINATAQEIKIENANSSSAMYTKRIKLKCPQFCKHLKYMNMCGDCQCVDLCDSQQPYYCNCTKVKARSCLDLQPYYSVNGFYNIYLNETPTTVYCDMETDDGGWTMIVNLTIKATDAAAEFSYDQIQDDDIFSLARTAYGEYILSSKGVRMLDDLMGFTQLRVYCHKPNPGRTVHITNTLNSAGLNALRFLLGKSDDQPTACGTYTTLSDDSSNLFLDCSNIGWHGKWSLGSMHQGGRLYNHIAFVPGLYHLNLITNRLECDDSMLMPGTESVGIWQYFLR